MPFFIPKHREQVNSKAYERYLRSCHCEGCGSWIGVQVSHMESRKWAAGSVLLALPACEKCHPQSTRAARNALELAGVDIEARIQFHQERFRKLHGLPNGSFEDVMIQAGLAERNDGSKRKNREPFDHFTNPFRGECDVATKPYQK